MVDKFGKYPRIVTAAPPYPSHGYERVSADILLGKLRARIEEYGAAIKSVHYEEPQFDGTADDGVIVFLSAKISEFDSAIAKLGKNGAPNSGEAD